ncbi:MAG: hypothetical protein JW818_06605 [Pirellulales bacterium]|nr:hypothetical protein [Pirellulales bacterium]
MSFSTPLVRRFNWAPLLLPLLLLAGCSESGDFLKTYPAKGTAHFEGKPMEHAVVTFYPIDGEAKARHLQPHGTVDAEGRYSLWTYHFGDGAPAGQYRVTLTWPNQPESRMGMPGYVADTLNGRYLNAEKSKIERTVDESGAELPAIELP